MAESRDEDGALLSAGLEEAEDSAPEETQAVQEPDISLESILYL